MSGDTSCCGYGLWQKIRWWQIFACWVLVPVCFANLEFESLPPPPAQDMGGLV